jgi:hypothetical protein
MELFYSGAFRGDEIQTSPLKSLGGYISSSKLPNDFLNNIFSEIPTAFILNNKEYIGIFLKNTSGIKKTNISIWTETPLNSFSSIKIAAVSVACDSNGCFIEKIPNKSSSPYNATFYKVEGEANAALLGDLDINKVIGLWLVREIDQTKLNSNISAEKLYEDFKNKIIPIEQETISLKYKFF